MRNHVRTSNALFEGRVSCVGAMKREGCSHQYAGYSASDVVDRINGGAVNEDKSPLNDAIVYSQLALDEFRVVRSVNHAKSW